MAGEVGGKPLLRAVCPFLNRMCNVSLLGPHLLQGGTEPAWLLWRFPQQGGPHHCETTTGELHQTPGGREISGWWR